MAHEDSQRPRNSLPEFLDFTPLFGEDQGQTESLDLIWPMYSGSEKMATVPFEFPLNTTQKGVRFPFEKRAYGGPAFLSGTPTCSVRRTVQKGWYCEAAVKPGQLVAFTWRIPPRRLLGFSMVSQRAP